MEFKVDFTKPFTVTFESFGASYPFVLQKKGETFCQMTTSGADVLKTDFDKSDPDKLVYKIQVTTSRVFAALHPEIWISSIETKNPIDVDCRMSLRQSGADLIPLPPNAGGTPTRFSRIKVSEKFGLLIIPNIYLQRV